MNRTVILIVGLCVLVFAAMVNAGVPQAINYQALLLNSSGDVVPGDYDIVFTMYDAASGGSVLWTETHPAVTVDSRGTFNVKLGSNTALDHNVLNGEQRWPGISVAGDTEISPRTEMLSSAYSFRVATVDQAEAGALKGSLVLEPSAARAAAELLIIGSLSDTISISPDNGTILRATNSSGQQVFEAGLSGVDNSAYIVITGPGGDDEAQYSSSGIDLATNNALSRALQTNWLIRSDIGIAALSRDNPDDTIINIREDNPGEPSIVLTNQSASRLSSGSVSLYAPGSSVSDVMTVRDALGDAMLKATVDPDNGASMSFYTPNAARANRKITEVSERGVVVFGETENDTLASISSSTGALKVTDGITVDWPAVSKAGRGDGAIEDGTGSSTIGPNDLSTANYSYAIGQGNTGSYVTSVFIVGNDNLIEDDLGDPTVWGDGSVAIGDSNIVKGNSSFCVGTSNWLGANRSVVFGRDNISQGSGQIFMFGDNCYMSDVGNGSITGGESDTLITASLGVISGGKANSITSTMYANIAGGVQNKILGDNTWAGGTIGGGSFNVVTDEWSTIAGGHYNQANGQRSTVGGGASNIADSSHTTVAGGSGNKARHNFAFVGGGYFNVADGEYSTIGGGKQNAVSGDHAFIGGGAGNAVTDLYGTIGGGFDNQSSESVSTVGGGSMNQATGRSSTVAGGYTNTASGWWSAVPGGALNSSIGDYSFASGRRAKAQHDGTYVWGDSTNSDFVSTAANQYLIRASGGVGIGTNAPSVALHVVGNICYTGTIGACSDARFKKNLSSLDYSLEKILKLKPINYQWKRGEFPDRKFTDGNQIGFLAQDVEKIIPEIVQHGKDGYLSIDYGRLTPVLVKAIQELVSENDDLKSANAELSSRLDKIEQRLAELAGSGNKDLALNK